MANEEPLGCGKPTGAVVGETPQKETSEENENKVEEKTMAAVMVGQKAPDFEAPAFTEGTVKPVKLSDHLGKWIVLCFYPGDFTFV